MKYGICQWNLPVKGPRGCYELKKLGLDGMELEYTSELSSQINEYKKAAEETGMRFPTLGLNVFCGTSYSKEGNEEYFENVIEDALRCADALGIKCLQIPAFFESDISNDEELAVAAKNLKKACELAEKYQIMIGSENALDAKMNIELCKLVDHPLFRFYFDNQNLWRMKGKRCGEVLAAMKDLLVEAHAKDSKVFLGKQKWKPLGKGDAEFDSSMKALKEFGYDGWIHLENDYQIDATKKRFDYEKAIKRDLSVLKNIFE